MSKEDEKALIVVADCARCGDAITANEPKRTVEGKRVCESCYLIAKAIGKK